MDTGQTNILSREKQTFRYDVIREGASGLIEAGWATFVILIALRFFDASPWIKASLAASAFIGMICTPFTLSLATRFKTSAEKLCMLYYALCGISLCISAIIPNMICYVTGIIIAAFIYAQRLPLIPYIYSENYRADRKGRLVSTAFITLYIAGFIFAELGAIMLDMNIELYRWILLSMGAASFIAAWSCSKMPSTPIKHKKTASPWESISLLWKDRLFGWLIISWAILGMSMLTLAPLKLEYLANPEYGLNMNNKVVAFLNYGLPAIAYVLSVKIWGKMYDRFNFITIRILVNMMFLIGVPLYFQFKDPYIIGCGACLIGLGFGGGKIAFNLWVTDLAPTGEVSSYMSAHLAVVGLRGITAPFLGYYLVGQLGINTLSACCSGFIALSALMFFLSRKHPRMNIKNNYSSKEPAFRA